MQVSLGSQALRELEHVSQVAICISQHWNYQRKQYEDYLNIKISQGIYTIKMNEKTNMLHGNLLLGPFYLNSNLKLFGCYGRIKSFKK